MSIYAVNDKEPVAAWIPSLDTEGQKLPWYCTQDGTGDHTVDLEGSGIAGVVPVIDATADALTVVEMKYVAGTGWRFV